MATTTNNQAAFTLGTPTISVVPFKDDHNYARSFVAATALPIGTPVELKNTGKVGVPAGETSLVIGVVVVPSKAADDRCTVVMQAKAIVNAEADGAITVGGQLFCSGISTDGVRPTFAPIASTGAVAAKAVALSSALDTAEVEVVIL